MWLKRRRTIGEGLGDFGYQLRLAIENAVSGIGNINPAELTLLDVWNGGQVIITQTRDNALIMRHPLVTEDTVTEFPVLIDNEEHMIRIEIY